MKILHARITFALFSIVFISACSKTPAPQVETNALWLRDGLIAISRPVPNISNLPSKGLLGFMPISSAEHRGSWVAIDKSKKTFSLMDGEKEVGTLSAEGLENLKPGHFQLLHKQKNALWYAPDSYFTSREIKIPAKGDRSRYLRGALGEFVLYIDKETPIYNGPIWEQDIGGIRLEDAEMLKLYSSIDVGAAIEVR